MSTPPHQSKPQRILACILCQQRKVKCSRTFPCTNCTRQKAQCVPATQPRPRRRRFPEKELLDRLRKYEELLKENGVKFEPLHPEIASGKKGGGDSEDELEFETFRDSKNTSTADPDFLNNHFRETVLATSWDRSMDNEDNILFGSRQIFVDICPLHPSPVQIFKLWQIYLDRVNPLLKVTHAPTLQNRIVDAASNLASVDAALQVLMFSIYCITITSLEPEDCQQMLGSSKEDMLMRFRFGCQQALMNASFLQTDEIDCLTGLYLYLLSTYAVVHARSLSSLLGIAIRIAQRMRIHDEAANSKQTVFDAEMRRRLWWALMLFDSRVSEVANSGANMQLPTWDCKIPLNVGDSELRRDMVETLAVQETPSDSIFVVVRCEIGEYIRRAPFHLTFANKSLKRLGQTEAGGNLSALETLVEKHLSGCKEDSPLQFLTIWTSRTQLAKYRLVESCSEGTNTENECSLNQALRLLQCDTILMTNPSVKGYHWFLRHYLPFSGYIHIMQHLKTRKMHSKDDWKQVGEIWNVLNDNFAARFNTVTACVGTQFKAFTNLVLGGWETLEATYKQAGVETPDIVLTIRRKVAGVALMNTRFDGSLASSDLNTEDEFNIGTIVDDQGYPMNGIGGIDDLSANLDLSNHEQRPFDLNMSNINSMEWK